MPLKNINKVPPAEARRIYLNQRRNLETRFEGDPRRMRAALEQFEANPAVAQVRQRAGLPAPAEVSLKRLKKPVVQQATRKQMVGETARRVVKKERQSDSIVPLGLRDIGASFIGSANDAFFGLPARAAAAISGTDNDLMQALADEQGQRAPVSNFLGTLGIGLLTGRAAVSGLSAGSRALAASSVPAAARAGQVAQTLGRAATVQRGQTGRNALRIAAGGAGVGAATEAGKGRDVGEGAMAGAGGALLFAGGAKGAGWLGAKAGEALRITGADKILQRYTKTTREELQRRLDKFRQEGRAEPTVYELLDLEDRQNLQKVFGRLDSGQQERGAQMARERVQSIPGQVADVVRTETRPMRERNIRNLSGALASSRGAPQANMAESNLAIEAADNPTRLAQLRRQEARNIMAPFDDRVAYDDLKNLVPVTLAPGKKPGEVIEVEADPEVGKVIRAAAGLARVRPEGEGITIREITGMITELKDDLPKASVIERGVIQRAVDHLEGLIAQDHPDVAPALARMNEAWAARSRQLEGMQEIRDQADIRPNTTLGLRRSENVFETPEGGVGRAMGQRNALIDDLGAGNATGLGTVRRLAESQTEGRRIAQNIGQPATNAITQAARAQSESARRLATAIRDPSVDQNEIEAGDLALLAAGLNPASMAYTKANALAYLFRRFGQRIPEGRSRVMVDMLFSGDPAMTQRAVNALRSENGGAETVQALASIMSGGATAAAGGRDGNGPQPAPVPEAATEEIPVAEADYAAMSDEELLAALEAEQAQGEADYATMSDEELLAALEAEQAQGPYGRRVIESLFPEAEVTDDLRDPNSDLGRANPGSYHNMTDGAVDIRPIPGMTFEEYIGELKSAGYTIREAKNEVGKGRSRHATGDHWHVVIE